VANLRTAIIAAVFFGVAVASEISLRFFADGAFGRFLVERLIGRVCGLISLAFIVLFFIEWLF